MLETRQGIWSEVSERHMIIYCLILQSTTWMSSARMDSLGHGCANDGLWHPCLFILSCLLPLSAFRLCWQNSSCSNARSGEGSGFAKCLLFLKKKIKSFFLKPFSWHVSQPFPRNSCLGKATGALYCSLETRRRAGDGMKQQYLRPLLPLGTRHCRAAALRSASSLAQTHTGTLESYLALLHLSTLISYAVKWNLQWLPSLVKIWAACEAFPVNVRGICYGAHA